MNQRNRENQLSSPTSHWLSQRITAVLLIPLSFHLVVFLKLCLNGAYQDTMQWLDSPVNSVFLLTWLLLTFYHAALGLQVVVEDYIGNRKAQAIMIKTVNFGFAALAILSVILLYKIS